MTRPEAIAEARRKLAAGDFDRMSVKTEPEDLFWDSVHLECGHTTSKAPMLGNLLTTPEGRQRCNDCAKEWIKANTDAKNEN